MRGPGNEASTRGIDKGLLCGCTFEQEKLFQGGWGLQCEWESVERVFACLCARVVPTLR